jgi:hypothetical protein
VSFTVSGSTASALVMMPSTARTGESNSGSIMRSMLYTASAESKVLPSWNVTLSRSVMVHSVRSALGSHVVASSGIGWKSLSTPMRRSNTMLIVGQNRLPS